MGHVGKYNGIIGVDALGGGMEDNREERNFLQGNMGMLTPTNKICYYVVRTDTIGEYLNKCHNEVV